MKKQKKFQRKHLVKLCELLKIPVQDKHSSADLVTAIVNVMEGKPPFPPPPGTNN